MACEECLDNGTLSGGIIDTAPEVSCLGDTLVFTVSGVVDSGGIKRVDCYAKTAVPPVTPSYTWVITKPDGSTVNGSGAVATVVADLSGSYACAFTAHAARECPPLAQPVGPETVDTCQGAARGAVGGPTCETTVTLKRITFLGDHPMHANAPPGTWGAGEFLAPPDWLDVNNPDHPICYTRNAPLTMAVVVEVEASGIEADTLRVQGPDGIVGTTPFNTTCGTSTVILNFSTVPTMFPDYVWRYEPMTLTWSFLRQGESTWRTIRATTHHTFVSYGTPVYENPVSHPPTQWRMKMLTATGLGQSNPLTITDAIHFSLNGNPPNDGLADQPGEIQSDDWDLLSGAPYLGECHDQTHLMNLMIQLLGLPPGSEYKTYASTDIVVDAPETTGANALGYTQDLDGNGVVGDEIFTLIFDFRPTPPALYNWNNFEGSLAAAGKYYAVWNSFAAISPCELYLAIVSGEDATQHWVLDLPDGSFYVHPATITGPVTCP